MKVTELIQKLIPLDPGREVVLSADSEGNGFTTLEDVELGVFNPEDQEIYMDPSVHPVADTDPEDFCPSEAGVPAVVLWP
jgi:hypothetical protein